MSSVLGIDVSSHAIDFVFLDETTSQAKWRRHELRGETSFQRLLQVQEMLPTRTWGEYDNVYLAAIERPKTRFMPSAAALFPIFGAVIACLPERLTIWDVSPTDWRKGLGLPGNAKKDICAAAVNALGAPSDPDWPQDAYDAYAVAYYARELNGRGVSLEEAREKQLVLTQ